MTTGKNKWIMILAATLILFWAAAPALAEQVTITGIVSDDFQIVDDSGQSYDVGESPLGDELVANAAGKRVQVTGTVEEEGGIKIIMVASYKVLSE